jgi:uncharacterized membrane protein
MSLLIAGVVLWSLVHLTPALAPGVRSNLVSRLGEKPFKGLFALDIVLALVLIVIGWRSTVPEIVYQPPAWGHSAAIGLMLVSVYLFGAAQRSAMIKRVLRHPQLTGLLTWSVAHLLANGDQRSLILFGGLGTWALLEMFAINRRDGAWVRPEAPPMSKELTGIAITLLVFAGLMWAHPYFAGVALFAAG